MERWQGRVAIVTGAGSGIGHAIARILSHNGMKVVGVDLDDKTVKDCLKGDVRALKCDVTKEEDVVRVVKWTRDNLGGADVLVNCAGVYHSTMLSETENVKMKRMLDTNVLGLSLFTREVIKDMRSRGVDDGHIVHMSSVSGQRIPDVSHIYFYSATKHAVKVLTEGLRRELRDLKTKIKITGISPGMVRTNLMVAGGISRQVSDEFFANFVHLEPNDVAEAVLYAIGTPPHVQVHEITIQAVGA